MGSSIEWLAIIVKLPSSLSCWAHHNLNISTMQIATIWTNFSALQMTICLTFWLHIDPEPYATLTAYCDPEAKTTQSRWPRSSPPNKWFLWDGFGRQFYLWNHHLWWISERQLQLRLVKLFNHNVSKMLEFLWQQKGICLHFLYKLHL